MTVSQLEKRVMLLEQEVRRLKGKSAVGGVAPLNGWLDEVHGTFVADATYRRSAKLGKQWRKSQSGVAGSAKKTPKK